MIQIPLSQIPSAEEFDAAVQAHRAALEAHRRGPAGVPAPRSHDLVEAVVGSVPDTNSVIAERGPDTLVVLPYEIVDDRPKPPAAPAPTPQDRKLALVVELHTAAAAARDALLSPARARLLSMDATAAMLIAEEARSPAEHAAIEAFTSFASACSDIQRRAAEIEISIEDLTPATIDGFSLPQF